VSVDWKRAERESAAYWRGSKTCSECGHRLALHNWHCCEFCKVCETHSDTYTDEYPCARHDDNRS